MRKSKQKMALIKTQVKTILTEKPNSSIAEVGRKLLTDYNQNISENTLSKLVSEIKIEQPTATATAPDSTDDEIENLTSIIGKLNKEFDKTGSNSERCRLGDAIGTAMKNREDLLYKKDERERARQTKDNRNIIIKFGDPTLADLDKCKQIFGEPKKPEIKPSENKPEDIPHPEVETPVIAPNSLVEPPKQDPYAPGPIIPPKCPMCGKPCPKNELKTWLFEGKKYVACNFCWLTFRNKKLHVEEKENTDDIL